MQPRRRLVFKKGGGVRVQSPRGKILYEGSDRRNLLVLDRRQGGQFAFRELREEDKGSIIKQEWLDEVKQKCMAANKGNPDTAKWIFKPAIEKRKGNSKYLILFDPRDNRFYWQSTRRKSFSDYDVSQE